MAIDIGAAAIDRADQASPNWTSVGLDNPASANGTIDTFEVWARYDMSGFRAGVFYLVSGTIYKCRDSETIGNVTAGSKQTFSGLSIDVVTGDCAGRYNSGGYLERDTSGGAGVYYKQYEYIDPGDEATYSLGSGYAESLYGMGTEGGGATEKQSSDSGAGADTRASANPVATINGSETGSGTDSLPARDIALPDSGAGVDALVSLQTPAAKTSSDTGAGIDAYVSLETPVAKTSSDTGSGVEAVPVYSALLASSEIGSGVEAFIARLLAAAEAGYGAESSEIGGGGLLKHLFASELGEGADGLTAKIEMPTKGGGMKLWT